MPQTREILVKNVEVAFVNLLVPRSFSGSEADTRFSVKCLIIPQTETGQLLVAQRDLEQKHDTLNLVRALPKEDSILKNEDECFVHAASRDRPLIDSKTDIRTGDLCDVVLEIYRVASPSATGLVARLIYIRKVEGTGE